METECSSHVIISMSRSRIESKNVLLYRSFMNINHPLYSLKSQIAYIDIHKILFFHFM